MHQGFVQSTIPLGVFLSGYPPQNPQGDSGWGQCMYRYDPYYCRGQKVVLDVSVDLVANPGHSPDFVENPQSTLREATGTGFGPIH
jgi:hypothetical protein